MLSHAGYFQRGNPSCSGCFDILKRIQQDSDVFTFCNSELYVVAIISTSWATKSSPMAPGVFLLVEAQLILHVKVMHVRLSRYPALNHTLANAARE